MGCECGQACCHTLGIISSILSVILLIGGFVLLIIFSTDDFEHVNDWTIEYAVGIGAICLGTLCSLLTLIYTCYAFRSKWKLYGCLRVKAPEKHMTRLVNNTLPSKEDVNDAKYGLNDKKSDKFGSQYNNGYNDGEQNGQGKFNSHSDDNLSNIRETDWDPETILGLD